MSVLCLILDKTDKSEVEGGEDKGYLNGSELLPVERQGGTDDNPSPVFILNTSILKNPDFATAHKYLGTLVQKPSDDPTFPPEMETE